MSMNYRKDPSDGFPFYGVFQRVDKPASSGLYVLETFQTIDGSRTRVVRGGFHDVVQAQQWIVEASKKILGEKKQ